MESLSAKSDNHQLLEAREKKRIQATSGWGSIKLSELWAYRDLVYFFIWRDLKVRYRQTILGASWAIIQPFFTMVIFSLFFGRLAQIPSDDTPYPIWNYSAMVPWTFFANGLMQASNTLVLNANMLKKIYFPRLTLPVATVLAGLVDFVLAFMVLIIMMLYYRIYPTIHVVWLPVFLLMALFTSMGTSLWFSAMNVQFRDVKYMIPFITQAWLFLSPVVYPSSLLKEPWRTIYGLNPMAGVVEGFRWALLDTPAPGSIIYLSSLISIILLVSGLYYFRRMERTFADVV